MNTLDSLDWDKVQGQVPAIIQDATNLRVLMLGYMTKDALNKTLETGHATFFSRSKQRLWTKGETSGNFLNVISIEVDCDQDTLLVKVNPQGPTCHKGTSTCFNDDKEGAAFTFLNRLFLLIQERNQQRPEGSYVTSLFESGRKRIAQKVGEEGVELALAHMTDDTQHIKDEAADLLFHTLILLEHAGITLNQVCETLLKRQTTTSGEQ